jgi:hypothetical protein
MGLSSIIRLEDVLAASDIDVWYSARLMNNTLGSSLTSIPDQSGNGKTLLSFVGIPATFDVDNLGFKYFSTSDVANSQFITALGNNTPFNTDDLLICVADTISLGTGGRTNFRVGPSVLNQCFIQSNAMRYQASDFGETGGINTAFPGGFTLTKKGVYVFERRFSSSPYVRVWDGFRTNINTAITNTTSPGAGRYQLGGGNLTRFYEVIQINKILPEATIRNLIRTFAVLNGVRL